MTRRYGCIGLLGTLLTACAPPPAPEPPLPVLIALECAQSVAERHGFLDYEGEDWFPWYPPPGGEFRFVAQRGDRWSSERVLVTVVALPNLKQVQVHAYGNGYWSHAAGQSSLATTQATHVAQMVREECSAAGLES